MCGHAVVQLGVYVQQKFPHWDPNALQFVPISSQPWGRGGLVGVSPMLIGQFKASLGQTYFSKSDKAPCVAAVDG